MKNSQYVNQVNVNIGEVARLTFNEVTPPDNEIIQVITISMHPEFLKVLRDVIDDTLNKYAEGIKNMQSNREVN